MLYRLFIISDLIALFLVSSPQQSGNLPIHWAAREGHEEVVRFLLEFDPNLYSDRVYEVSL